ncbi:TetR/AcrR family transcriptional regulator C-terminal domain-containing protein [Streptomyces niveus]|uniref:TetR/AcrR family transcriptional regulator C-terminal domain-containing protein n=1 Tax=Streptomyces niveus TaxID=193462 RepID=UPI00343DCA9C
MRKHRLAATFQRFSGMLLWIPVNKAMFHGGPQHTQAELDHYADEGVRVFLVAYR